MKEKLDPVDLKPPLALLVGFFPVKFVPDVTEVGHRGVKERRRTRAVDVGSGGVTADYVPFYYAPRSQAPFLRDRTDRHGKDKLASRDDTARCPER